MRLTFGTACAASLVLLASAAPAGAQRVLGVGDDATVLPRGVLRIRGGAEWISYNERYGSDTPGRRKGALEPLGTDFTLDTLGTAQLPGLGPLQSNIRSVAATPAFNLSLGATRLVAENRVQTTPIRIELGLAGRLALDVTVPIVKTRSQIFFSANPRGTEGNVAFNPALASAAAFAADTSFVNQLTRAATQVAAFCASPSGAATPQCAQGAATAAAARMFADGLGQIYGSSPFVPITGSSVQSAIDARIAFYKSSLNSFAAFGVTPITAAGVLGAGARLTTPDVQRILTDPAFGISADALATRERIALGDVEVGGKVSVFDSFGRSEKARLSPHGVNFRLAVGGVVRLPTGRADPARSFTDIGTGGGQMDLEARVYSDILLGSRFWSSFVMRYNDQLAANIEKRITDSPGDVFAAAYRQRTVRMDPGNILELEATPRLVLNDFFSVSGQYLYRRKGTDRYTGTFVVPAAVTGYNDVTLDAATLNASTETTEHRFGGGISFSNRVSFEQGRTRFPVEVTYLHAQTTRGMGRNVPKLFIDQVQIRLYARIFGN